MWAGGPNHYPYTLGMALNEYRINTEAHYLFYTLLMPFLMYRDSDSGLRPLSYPYILGRALNEYRIYTSVIIYYIDALLF